MRIQVTQKHIDEGERCDCIRCPVALAINECLPRGLYSVLNVWTAQILHRGKPMMSVVCDLPARVESVTSDFDSGRPVSPFSFELPIDHLCGVTT